jgi:hypothetical protein
MVKATCPGKMTQTNISRAQKQRDGSPTTVLALRDPPNMARKSFLLLISLEIKLGLTLKVTDIKGQNW